jgi:tetratricopeptide (TPR) repeat protein
MGRTFDIISLVCAILLIISMLVVEPLGYIRFKYGWTKYFFIFMMILAAIISWMSLKGKFRSENLILAKKFYEQGHVFNMKGDLDAAISNYKMAVNMYSDFAPAHNALGHAFFSKGKLNKSIKEFKEAIRIDPKFGSAYCSLGAALAGAGKMDEAILEFRKAVELEPNNVNAREALERALKEVNQNDLEKGHEKKSADEVYSNEEYGFSIKCPKGWRINTKLPPEMLVCFTDLRGGSINLMAGSTYGTQESIEDLENLAIQNVNRLNGKMESLKRIKLDNIEAIEAIYLALGLKTKKVGFVKDGIEYLITCGIKPNLFDEYEPIFDKCIQSFKFRRQDQEKRLSKKNDKKVKLRWDPAYG